MFASQEGGSSSISFSYISSFPAEIQRSYPPKRFAAGAAIDSYSRDLLVEEF